MPNLPRLLAIPLVLAAIGAFAVGPLLRAEEPVAPDSKKADAPEEAAGLKKEPAPVADVTDAAKPVLDKLRDAYAKLGGLQMSGTWSATWDIDGEQGKESTEFTSSYAAPNKFRHEIKNDLLFGSTGEKAYGLQKNQYFTEDAAKDHVAIADLPKKAGPLLKEKDPSLLLAVTTSQETPFLAEGATRIDKGDDVKIGDASFTALKIKTKNGADVTVLLDPATSLIRQWTIDLKSAIESRGGKNVKSAAMTIDYTAVKPEAPAGGNEAFAWVPPAGAKDAKAASASLDEEAEALVLKGKPAPAFELKDLDDKVVRLADLKGQVVVLDFWATWCGPCRVGLPVLDKVAAARKGQPLKVYAVNKEEEKDMVVAFKNETKLGLDVLLDPTGATNNAYYANLIPLTIVVGKDGVVKKVMAGLHDQADLEKAIDEELK